MRCPLLHEDFAVGEPLLGQLMGVLAAQILARGDVDHLLGDHARLGPFVLRDLVAIEPAQRLVVRGYWRASYRLEALLQG